MIEFYDVHVVSTLIIYFFRSLSHKSSHTVSWTYYNLDHIYNTSPFLIRHLNQKSHWLCKTSTDP